MELHLIPKEVLAAVRQRETFTDKEIAELSPRQLFDEYCTWHGLLRWGDSLWDTVDKLKSATDEFDPKIVVTMNNGVVREATATRPSRVLVVEYDDPHADPDSLVAIPQAEGQDDEAGEPTFLNTVVDPHLTEAVFEAAIERRPLASMKP